MLGAMLRLLAVAVVALAVCSPVLARGLSAPKMRMTDAAPATVQGSGFQPREIVRLVLTTAGKAQAHRLLTTTGGKFSTRWSDITVDLCSSWQIKATGSKGSRALLHSRPNPCPPPPPIE
jgi:hypothetical protein